MAPPESTPLLSGNSEKESFRTFLSSFWPLAFISFGGPQAHVALLHDRFVDAVPPAPPVPESTFLELYALSQSLPGPGSTQLAVSLGATFGGATGALITFLVWHLPGFIVMSLAGLWFHAHLEGGGEAIGRLTEMAMGLIAAAFSFVLLAAFKIVGKVCAGDNVKMGIALVSMFVAVVIPPQASSWVFIALLIGGGAVYYAVDSRSAGSEREDDSDGEAGIRGEAWEARVSARTGMALLAMVVIITLVISFLPAADLGNRVLQKFWRIGLCVFGGGVVVVPMLLNELVESGLLPTSVFLAGFGLFGCVPGPMFNLAPFLGTAILGWRGAFYGSFGLFGPGILLQIGLLPFWERVRKAKSAQVFLQGTNCAASGLIMAGVWMLLQKALVGPSAFAITCLGGALGTTYKVKPGVNVVVCGALGFLVVMAGIGGPFHAAGSSV